MNITLLQEMNVNNPFIYEVQLRFCDLDGLGHINNAIYVTYMELARTYWQKEIKSSLESFDWILGSIHVRFIKEALITDAIRIFMWVSRIGTKSWDFTYAFINQKDEIIAKAASTQIGFDYKLKKSAEISEDIVADINRRVGVAWKEFDFDCPD